MRLGLGLGFNALRGGSAPSPPSLFPNWSAALAAQNAGTKSPVIMALGDSTTFGSYSNGTTSGNLKDGSYPTQLRALFAGGGRAAQINSIIANGSSTNEKSNTNDSRMTKGANWATANAATKAIGGYCVSHNQATLNNCTYTFPGINTFRVWYPLQPGGGNLLLSVDGGTVTTVTTANATESVAYIDIAAGSAGTHTLTVAPDSSAIKFILGVEGFNSAASEIKIRNCGWAGSQTTAWIENTHPWSPLSNMSGFAPDLTILCLGINDWVNNLNTATFQTQYQAIVTAIKAVSDLLIVTPVPSDDSVRAYASQVNYVNAILAVAIATGTQVVDAFNHFGTYATANANGWMGNVSHPNTAGYGVIAGLIYDKIKS